MRIKYFAATSLAAATALLLAGCTGGGGTEPSADGEVSGTLTGIFASAFKDTYAKIATEFEKEYPDVEVKFDYQGGDIGQLVMTQLQGNTAPDILTSFPGGAVGDSGDTVVSLAAAGRVAPLDVTWGDQIPEGWENNFSYDGEVYSFPGAFQPLTSIYNKTKLDELGLTPPTTLTEVYQFCADAQAKGVYAYGQGLGDAAIGPQFLTYAQSATLVWGADPGFDAALAAGDATYTDSAFVDQFTIYKKMFDDGCFGEGALGRSRDQGATEVAAGNALSVVDVGGVLPSLQAQGPDNEYVVVPMPADDSGETLSTALPGFVTTVNASAKNPAAAQAFLEFMGKPEISAIYADGFQSVPVLPNDQYTPPAALESFAAAVAAGETVPLGTVRAEVQTTLNERLQSLFLGDTTPEGVAEAMQEAQG
ncbi:extracellular solute-binding protein [Microbacteriaceae bacterium VKM Ac-2855]|nr:extracellular solute-binding protein [Microbacteriaceae bacterium VKM Ac-2855]